MSLVTGTSQPDAATKKIPGEAGIWVFIFGDLSVFAVLFVYYLVERSKQVDLFAVSQATLHKNYGAINTMVLLSSSLFMVLAVQAMRAAQRELAQRLTVGAFLCGIAFFVIKLLFEYREHIAAHQIPTTNSFYLLYFVLTGLHLFHVFVGLAVLTALFFLARKVNISKNQWAFFEGGACYWHMVDMLWLILFALIFLVR